jgi:hypothetical protein
MKPFRLVRYRKRLAASDLGGIGVRYAKEVMFTLYG